MDYINTPKLVEKYYEVSIDRENDKYNNRGVNISSQKRRQVLIPWTKVNYKK